MVEINQFQSPIGLLTLAGLKEGVVRISSENVSLEELAKWCQKNLGMGITEGTHFITKPKSQILNYLSSRTKSLDFPVVHINSPFRKKVLEAQRKIPYGHTRSYREVAKMAGHPKAIRAAGSANANNPLPLYFPCHRVINSNGQLGGFGWGIDVKQYLLGLESKYL